MGLAALLIFALFAVPLALIYWWYAILTPQRGRVLQERVWRPIAARLRGLWSAASARVRFHTMSIPIGETVVTVGVLDRMPIDEQIVNAVPWEDPGGWRTFVMARVIGPGAAFTIRPRSGPRPGLAVGDAAVQRQHHIAELLATPPQLVHMRLTPDACQALVALGASYQHIAVGPGLIVLTLPGVCGDPHVLEAAIAAVSGLANHSRVRRADRPDLLQRDAVR